MSLEDIRKRQIEEVIDEDKRIYRRVLDLEKKNVVQSEETYKKPKEIEKSFINSIEIKLFEIQNDLDSYAVSLKEDGTVDEINPVDKHWNNLVSYIKAFININNLSQKDYYDLWSKINELLPQLNIVLNELEKTTENDTFNFKLVYYQVEQLINKITNRDLSFIQFTPSKLYPTYTEDKINDIIREEVLSKRLTGEKRRQYEEMRRAQLENLSQRELKKTSIYPEATSKPIVPIVNVSKSIEGYNPKIHDELIRQRNNAIKKGNEELARKLEEDIYRLETEGPQGVPPSEVVVDTDVAKRNRALDSAFGNDINALLQGQGRKKRITKKAKEELKKYGKDDLVELHESKAKNMDDDMLMSFLMEKDLKKKPAKKEKIGKMGISYDDFKNDLYHH
jgi:hypothetical protein